MLKNTLGTNLKLQHTRGQVPKGLYLKFTVSRICVVVVGVCVWWWVKRTCACNFDSGSFFFVVFIYVMIDLVRMLNSRTQSLSTVLNR